MTSAQPLALLVLSLPTGNSTARMRAWRSLKACGAAVLRDGVYALPDAPEHRRRLQEVAEDVAANEGIARLLVASLLDEPAEPLFDRAAEFAELLAEAQRAAREGPELQRGVRRLRRSFEQLTAIDYFPSEAQRQAAEAIEALERRAARQAATDEPQPVAAAVPRLDRGGFQGRLWVTRERPWVDRLASAWLIRRFIDTNARLEWSRDPARAPRDAIGYDYDGARFTHVGARVTFETLLAAFDLETPALLRLGTVVHSLDAGGVMPPEASGVEQVLAGLREAITDDSALTEAAAAVFDGLHRSFERAAGGTGDD